MKRRAFSIFNFLLILIILFFSFSCQTVETESGMKKKFTNINTSPEELRLRLNEYTIKFSGEVISAADEIKEKTDDLQIKQNALLWKMNSIPVANKILFTIDPYAAAFDMWVFLIQMKSFFKDGYGKDIFGENQSIAVQVSQKLEDEMIKIVGKSTSDSTKIIANEQTKAFAEENPIKNLTFSRQSTIEFLAEYMADHERSMASSFGSMETAITDLSTRINIYYEQLPKIASWNIEYLTNEAKMSGDFDSLKSKIASVTKSFERIALVSERAEDIVNSSILQLYNESINLKEQLLKDLQAEREIILSSLSNERELVLTEIDKQRLETIIQLEKLITLTMNNATLQAEDIVDYIFFRVVILLTIIYFIALITYRYYIKGTRAV